MWLQKIRNHKCTVDGISYILDLLVMNGTEWHPTPVLLPGISHGRRSPVGCSPWGHEELDTTEWLHFHFSLSCIGEGNGNPLQCSCLENPRNGGAWWAAVYGVTQSRTRLKWLSSSSPDHWGYSSEQNSVLVSWTLQSGRGDRHKTSKYIRDYFWKIQNFKKNIIDSWA